MGNHFAGCVIRPKIYDKFRIIYTYVILATVSRILSNAQISIEEKQIKVGCSENLSDENLIWV